MDENATASKHQIIVDCIMACKLIHHVVAVWQYPWSLSQGYKLLVYTFMRGITAFLC